MPATYHVEQGGALYVMGPAKVTVVSDDPPNVSDPTPGKKAPSASEMQAQAMKKKE